MLDHPPARRGVEIAVGVAVGGEPGHLIDADPTVGQVNGRPGRHPVAGGDRHVPQRVGGRGEVEIDERHGSPVARNHVLDAEVVVPDHDVGSRRQERHR